MKIFNYLFGFLFTISAILQYNDPDPLHWIILFMTAAVLCFMAARNKYYPKAYLTAMVIYLTYAGYILFFQEGFLEWFHQHKAEELVQTMQAEKPWIEETREFGGLLIMTIAMAINWITSSRR